MIGTLELVSVPKLHLVECLNFILTLIVFIHVGKADLDEKNGIIGEDVLGFEVGAVEDEVGEDGKVSSYASN